MELTKQNIVSLLESNDKAVARALVVLNNRQNVEEQNAEATIYHNMRGFRPCHANKGTGMAKFFEKNGFLSKKQVDYWRKRDKNGNMRIAIYWKQLIDEAKAKQQAKGVS